MTFFLINYVFVLISLLPSVLLGRRRGERIEEKMRKKKTKKMEDDAAATCDEAGGRGQTNCGARFWILALISLVRLGCKSESVCRTEIDRESLTS